MSFYKVPDNIINPITEKNLVSGRIVLPLDTDGQLKAQLESLGNFDSIITSTDDSDYLDTAWWKSLPDFDWTVAITQGCA